MSNSKVTPLFKYIGGKTWLKERLNKEVDDILNKNKDIDTYIEPFAGGLGAFLGIYETLLKHNIKTVIINDINHKLVNFYNTIKNDSDKLIKEYIHLEESFASKIPEHAFKLHKIKDKIEIKSLLEDAYRYYIEVRNSFNNNIDNIKSAAALLFLQHHCFNGIYRENSKGGYNTPFNWEIRIVTEAKIRDKVLAVLGVFNSFNITFTSGSFENVDYSKNALYYLDPPYINEVEALENSYNKDVFNIDSQLKLINLIKDTKFLYSNHDNNILIEAFKNIQNIDIINVPRKNIISASKDSRKNDKIEILVKRI